VFDGTVSAVGGGSRGALHVGTCRRRQEEYRNEFEGVKIKKVDELCRIFGGRKKDWKKKKGWDRSGNEWYWYENQGVKCGWKRAGEKDPLSP
jgi:hypothetical protein